MSVLSKLLVKSVQRTSHSDPSMARRQKVTSALDEQVKVAEAKLKGEIYSVQRKTWAKNELGEKVLIDRLRKVRPWFFEQDGGWYVQAKYGSRTIKLGEGNAIFVKTLKDVPNALETLKTAVEVGELDEAISNAAKRSRK